VTLRSFQVGLLVMACSAALGQSSGDVPLGDVARNIRRAKVTTKAADVHVDNDNFSKIMENSEARRMQSMQPAPAPLGLSFLGLTPGTAGPSPDVSCSLTFSAKGIRLLDSIGPTPGKDVKAGKLEDTKVGAGKVEPSKPEAPKLEDGQVPASELAKIEGPATISGDSLQLSIYNGTTWQIQEITIGLTILRHPSKAAVTMSGPVVQASAVQIVAKRSDTLMVYHMKGSALPNTRATFTEPLGIKLGADQEWHWAIIEAKGSPAKPKEVGSIN